MLYIDALINLMSHVYKVLKEMVKTVQGGLSLERQLRFDIDRMLRTN